MSDSVEGNAKLILQPGDSNVPCTLRLKAATASTNNDGSMPYGSTLASSTWSAYDSRGVAFTTSMIITTVNSSNKATAYLTYSSALTAGMHKLTAKCSFSLSGSTRVMVREYDINRILVKNL